METLFANLNIGMIESRVIAVSIIIIANLILSISEAIKQKKFSVKKLPEFISEWTMCVLSILVVELVISVMLNEPYVVPFLESIRNVMFISILACYLKKIYESMIGLGWDVIIDISKITGKDDNSGK